MNNHTLPTVFIVLILAAHLILASLMFLFWKLYCRRLLSFKKLEPEAAKKKSVFAFVAALIPFIILGFLFSLLTMVLTDRTTPAIKLGAIWVEMILLLALVFAFLKKQLYISPLERLRLKRGLPRTLGILALISPVFIFCNTRDMATTMRTLSIFTLIVFMLLYAYFNIFSHIFRTSYKKAVKGTDLEDFEKIAKKKLSLARHWRVLSDLTASFLF